MGDNARTLDVRKHHLFARRNIGQAGATFSRLTRWLDAIPPFPFSPVRFSALMARLFPRFIVNGLIMSPTPF